MATDNVLAQRCGGVNIPAGKKIEEGTKIDLVVGLNSSDNMTLVPDLIGMKCLPATDAVHSNSLNVRAVYDSSVKDYNDSLKAIVYSQSPSAEVRSYKGSQVTMFLTIDSEKYSKENADGATE
jgi:beta-lactam-binding protein with PASTA domain